MRSGSTAHLRIRHDHASETAEDYVEAISEMISSKRTCRVVDLATHFGVSHVTVTRIISRLQNKGLVTTAPYRPITLTLKGQNLATESRTRHEIVFQFLLAIGVEHEIAAIDAEGLEHHVSSETAGRMRSIVDAIRSGALTIP